MRKKRRRSEAAPAALFASLLCLLALALPCAQAAEKKKPKSAPQALLFGSVFQENGFLLRGARVVVSIPGHPKDRKETTTDVQGEFALRLPAGKARYTVEVSAQGFASAKKEVEVAGDERIDLTFRLAPLAETGERR